MFRELVDIHRTIKSWRAARQLRRRFRRATKHTLASLPEDTLAKVRGHARPIDDTLVAPISERPCLYWVVEVFEVPLEPGARALQIAAERHGVPFAIYDADWRGIVEPTGADVLLVFDHVADSRNAFDATKPQRAFLEKHGLAHRDWTGALRIEYREAVIELDEAVTVLGSGTREPDPDAAPDGYRGEARTRLRLTSSASYPLAITDEAGLE